jgi:hypothetical protein
MQLKQISVFLENSAGRIAEVTKTLADVGINLRALSIADTADFGILRIIVDNNEAAQKALSKAGFTIRETAVAAVELVDTPGSLAKVMEIFKASKVNIEYLYASLKDRDGKAVVIFKLADHEKGLQIIKENGLTLVDGL